MVYDFMTGLWSGNWAKISREQQGSTFMNWKNKPEKRCPLGRLRALETVAWSRLKKGRWFCEQTPSICWSDEKGYTYFESERRKIIFSWNSLIFFIFDKWEILSNYKKVYRCNYSRGKTLSRRCERQFACFNGKWWFLPNIYSKSET